MAQPFSFPPPPPPPPPKPAQSIGTVQEGNRGAYRGRGGFQPGIRGQERPPPNTGLRGGNTNRGRNNWNSTGAGHASTYGNGPVHQRTTNYDRPNAGQKRDHASAFRGSYPRPPSTELRNSRPLAPPAVPSFGIDFNSLLPKKPEPNLPPKPAPPPKKFSLGLTPASRLPDSDDEEDDNDEESKLASSAAAQNNLLQFEYKGQTSTLNTPEEIAAWIAERRKKFPTAEKQAIAKREAEERKKKWEDEKFRREEQRAEVRKAKQEEWEQKKLEREKEQLRQKMLKEHMQKATKAYVTQEQSQTAAEYRAEKLRRKAEKVAQQLKMAEAALVTQDHGIAGDSELDTLLDNVEKAADVQASHQLDLINAVSELSDVSSDSRPDIADETSTSGSSSESDSDDPPEESTSKRQGPDRVLPPPRKAVPGQNIDTRPVCTSFAREGRCKFGRKCRFRHEKPKRDDEVGAGKRRKGLYQVMVEKEKEEERRQALRAIIALGDAGLLDDVQYSTTEVA